jgi:hypothetical protein
MHISGFLLNQAECTWLKEHIPSQSKKAGPRFYINSFFPILLVWKLYIIIYSILLFLWLPYKLWHACWIYQCLKLFYFPAFKTRTLKHTVMNKTTEKTQNALFHGASSAISSLRWNGIFMSSQPLPATNLSKWTINVNYHSFLQSVCLQKLLLRPWVKSRKAMWSKSSR